VARNLAMASVQELVTVGGKWRLKTEASQVFVKGLQAIATDERQKNWEIFERERAMELEREKLKQETMERERPLTMEKF
jgi:hypothetical protein